MRLTRIAAWAALAILLALTPVHRAAAWQEPITVKPGPEHAVLKMDEGVWDAMVEVNPGPGAPPMTSKGVETNTMGCGGLCLITDFKGELMPGMAFTGHGTTVWDVVKKKYVGTWTDSMSTGMAIGEMTWDPDAKKMSGWSEGPDATGKLMRSRTEVQHKENSRVMTAHMTGPDGKEMQMMRITYTRRK
jgi:hypothetical protein